MASPARPGARPHRATAIGHRAVLAIAVPMTLAHLSTPLVGLVNSTLIGRLGDAALMGGIAVGALAFDILFSFFSFLRMGTTGQTAQALGARDGIATRAVLIRAVAAALATGLVIVALAHPLQRLFVLAIGASPAVNAAFAGYFAVRVLAAPLTLVNYSLLGWVVGLGRAGLGLLLQVVLNGVNIVAGLVLIVHFRLGIAGAAWSAVAAEAAAALAGLAIAARLARGGRWPDFAALRDRAALMATFAINRDIMIRSVALMVAFGFFTAESARHGDVVLAANSVLMNLTMVAAFFLDGLATAAEQLCGRALGARARADFVAALRLSIGWGFALSVLLAAFFMAAGPAVIDLMTIAPAVRAAARHFLVWAAAAPVAGVLAYELDGVFIGATWSATMRNMMLLSLGLYFVLWALLVPPFGNHGLWAAMVGFLGARGFTLAARLPARLNASLPG